MFEFKSKYSSNSEDGHLNAILAKTDSEKQEKWNLCIVSYLFVAAYQSLWKQDYRNVGRNSLETIAF